MRGMSQGLFLVLIAFIATHHRNRLTSPWWIVINIGVFKLHIKFQERRTTILLKMCADIDEKLKDFSASISKNIRISSSITQNEREAAGVERRIKLEVDKVMSVPAASIPGITLRRDLLRRLSRIRNYVDYILLTETIKHLREMNMNRNYRSSQVRWCDIYFIYLANKTLPSASKTFLHGYMIWLHAPTASRLLRKNQISATTVERKEGISPSFLKSGEHCLSLLGAF